MVKTWLFGLFVVAGGVEAAPECTVTTFNQQFGPAKLLRVDESGRLVFSSEGRDLPIRQDEIIEIVWKSTEAGEAQEARLEFVNADVLLGKVAGGEGGTFRFLSPSCGEVVVNLKGLQQIAYSGRETAESTAAKFQKLLSEEMGKTDVAVLVNGDVLPCVVQDVTADRVKIRSDLGELAIKADRLYGVRFAAIPGQEKQEKKVQAVVESVFGEILTGELEAATEETLVLNSGFGPKARFAMKTIRRVSFKNGAVIFLSDLEPERVVETPFFDVVYPYKRDKSVDGNALKLGGRAHRKGLGVHSKSEMTYLLDGGYSKFQATIGIDDEVGKKGSVVFCVLGDGKELYRSPEITGGAEPVALDVAAKGMKRLTLLVDFGQDFHIADHADWADARLVR
jgi:hypothetical protein